jgi:hypothetical protein
MAEREADDFNEVSFLYPIMGVARVSLSGCLVGLELVM